MTLKNGSEQWLVSRHADVRRVLADRRFSADDTDPDFPRLLTLPPTPGALSFLRMDDPDHGRMRRMLAPEFTVRRIAAMRPGVERSVDDLLGRMVAGGAPADLVREFALPLPSQVICQLLGVPYEDHEFFQECSIAALDMSASRAETGAAFGRLAAYLEGLVAAKLSNPTDDLLGRVCTTWVHTGELAETDLVAMARLLLIAGHDTTANMITLGTLALLRNPDQLAQLRGDPALAGAAAEELLRYLSIIQVGLPRLALADVDVGGVTIRAGEGLVMSLASANRDNTHFADPDALDVRRDRGHHVAFGFGMHQCIGAALARL
ncbi:MAG: cytochrome P450, partial [Streptosporangiaceae bacterium]